MPVYLQAGQFSACFPQSMITPAAPTGAAHFAISLSTNFCRYSGDRRSGATRSYSEFLHPAPHV